METTTKTAASPLAEKIGKGLQKAQQEIEEMVVQFALGTAEAKDKFDELKKEVHAKTGEWKTLVSELTDIGKEKVIFLKSKLEELQVQLTLGKADALDAFELQRKNIVKVIDEIEREIKSIPQLKGQLDTLRNEMEKFKIKMEIIKLKFELKKFDVKDGFKEEMTSAKLRIDKFVDQIRAKVEHVKDRYTDFEDEIDIAYKHLRKAVGKL